MIKIAIINKKKKEIDKKVSEIDMRIFYNMSLKPLLSLTYVFFYNTTRFVIDIYIQNEFS
jgi:hypothetical protein